MVAAFELITLTASATLLANRSLIRGPVDILSRVDGFKRAYYGFSQESNVTSARIFVDWKSIDHARNGVGGNPEVISAVLAQFEVIAVQMPSLFFVETDVNYNPAIAAPLTEITVIDALTADKTEEDFQYAAGKLEKALKAHVPAGGVYLPGVYGNGYVDPSQFIIYQGWKSIEARQAAASIKEVKKARERLQSLFNGSSTSYTPFTKYQ